MAFITTIGFDNLVESAFTFTNVVSSGGGSINNEVNNSALFNRSITDSYSFRKTSGGTQLKLTITPDYDIPIKLIALLGYSNDLDISAVNFFLNAGAVTNLDNDVFVENKRFVDSNSISGNDKKDYVLTWDNYITVDKIEIFFDVNTGIASFEYGSFYAGDKLAIQVEPKITYSTQDFSKKDRSNGGLVFSAQYAVIRTVKFKTTVIPTSEMFSTVVNSPTLVNAKSGSSEPIIFIPQTQDNTLIYGTQKKPCTISQVLGKNSSGEWYWAAAFEIEEEL